MRKAQLVRAIAAVMLFVLCIDSVEAQRCSMYQIELQGQIGDSYGGNAFRRAGTLNGYPWATRRVWECRRGMDPIWKSCNSSPGRLDFRGVEHSSNRES